MGEKKIYLGTNMKMYKNITETVCYLEKLKLLTGDVDKAEIFVIPSYTALSAASKVVAGSRIRLGAQNMFWEEKGQFTGEISPTMLQELLVDIVEIGHSERRHIFKETDEDEAKKVSAAVQHDFTALLCVGENIEQKKYGISDEILSIQLKKGLSQINREQCQKLMIAYEPVWAIGVNGIPAHRDYVNERHHKIRDILVKLFGVEEGGNIPLLYGGSVNPENAVGLAEQEYIDGLFIGRSAWDAQNFNAIIRMVLEK